MRRLEKLKNALLPKVLSLFLAENQFDPLTNFNIQTNAEVFAVECENQFSEAFPLYNTCHCIQHSIWVVSFPRERANKYMFIIKNICKFEGYFTHY